MNQIRSGSEQGRSETGQFVPGVSGNPNGRPPGRTDKRVNARDELLGPILPEAIGKLHAAVQEGERWAIELVVSYSLPKPRPVDPEEMRELEQRLEDLEQIAASRN